MRKLIFIISFLLTLNVSGQVPSIGGIMKQLTGSLNFCFDLSTIDTLSETSYTYTNTFSAAFSDDGYHLYLCGTSDDILRHYELIVPFDLTTASQSDSISIGIYEGSVRGIFIKADGTKIFVTGSSGVEINSFSITTPFDLSTASWTSLFDLSTQMVTPNGVVFTTDGSGVYLSDLTNDKFYQFSLSTAWDITTCSYVGASITLANINQGISMSSDGRYFFTIDINSKVISSWETSVLFSVSDIFQNNNSNALPVNDNSPLSLWMNNNGTYGLYIGATAMKIYSFTMCQ